MKFHYVQPRNIWERFLKGWNARNTVNKDSFSAKNELKVYMLSLNMGNMLCKNRHTHGEIFSKSARRDIFGTKIHISIIINQYSQNKEIPK